jgi:BlaI family transcriptional regulator, penicillinase repressor
MKLPEPPLSGLSRRESQIMAVLYRRGRATAAEVQADLADAPSYSSVRKLLQILEDKDRVRHEEEGRRYVYLPLGAGEKTRRSALRGVVDTFFGGSVHRAVSALIAEEEMTEAELQELLRRVRETRR